MSQVEQPSWFCQELNIKPNSQIIVLDDDTSIHNAWDERFSNLNVKLQHFSNSSDFYKYVKYNACEVNYYLIDYELIMDNKNGLDIIKELQLNHNAIIVTSCFEDSQLRFQCELMSVKIIPKSYVPFIKIVQSQNDDFVDDKIILIDDDEMIRATWLATAENIGKKIITFSSFENFMNAISTLSKNSTIYIDSDLGDKSKGEIYAKYLFEHGFTNIYLTTGYLAEQFDFMPWIKSIVGKDPLLIL